MSGVSAPLFLDCGVRSLKISEISAADVAAYLRLEEGDYNLNEITAVMAAAESYIASFTGIPAGNGDESAEETLDDHEDFYAAYMVLCQDMYDNRSYIAESGGVNRAVESILGMHARNLL